MIYLDPHIYSEFTESTQITAHASRFDSNKSLQLVDSTHTSRVLHFDTSESRHGWVAFDCKHPLYMVKSRIQNGCNSDVEVQYSDDGLDWKTCCSTSLLSTYNHYFVYYFIFLGNGMKLHGELLVLIVIGDI